jgi:predicted Zn-dependent protease
VTLAGGVLRTHMFETVAARFRANIPDVDFASLRVVRETSQAIDVRQGVLQPVQNSDDVGAMVVVHHRGGSGYSATSDLSASGIASALAHARRWAERSAPLSVTNYSEIFMSSPRGTYATTVQQPWDDVPLSDKIAMLMEISTRLRVDDRIVDWDSSLWFTHATSLYLTSAGGEIFQEQSLLVPNLSVAANDGADTVERSLGGRGYCRQGGLELLEDISFGERADRIAMQALELLDAPQCPEQVSHLLLAPDQMMLQIHESIGHPVELDRILGDERNYAGTSFVTMDMFGTYRYGSELLNVTYDPTLANQFASFAWDDEGVAAEKAHIIRNGVLERPLGSAISQHRANAAAANAANAANAADTNEAPEPTRGVANARANGWNRPAIDRMANLNLEPGDKGFDQLVGSVERGVYMETNLSWSIDDSRNKFQFGCEYGRLIEDGELKGVLRNPNYRGVSATFWRNLVGVGDASTFEVLGTPFCGKGEPNQVIRVGHASPACLFDAVQIFGGA